MTKITIPELGPDGRPLEFNLSPECIKCADMKCETESPLDDIMETASKEMRKVKEGAIAGEFRDYSMKLGLRIGINFDRNKVIELQFASDLLDYMAANQPKRLRQIAEIIKRKGGPR